MTAWTETPVTTKLISQTVAATVSRLTGILSAPGTAADADAPRCRRGCVSRSCCTTTAATGPARSRPCSAGLRRPSQALAGYAVLMVGVQIRLLPRFLALRFTPGFWAFTFSWAAATDALAWAAVRKPPGAAAYAVVILAVITAFVGYIAARTVVLAVRCQLLPPRVPPEKINSEIIPNEGVVLRQGISP
jgi:hypothetical protein